MLLIGVTAIWGTTFLIVQNSLSELSPLLFLLFRFGLASAILLAIHFRGLTRAAFIPGVISGIFLFGGYSLQTVGLQFTTASKSAFLTSLSVPMVPFAAALVYRVAPRKSEILGLICASVGMLLLTVTGRIDAIGKGDVLSFFGAVSFAAQIVAVSYYAGRGNVATFVTVQMMTVTLLSLATFRWAEPLIYHPGPAAWLAILVTALFATVLAFSVQAWAQKRTTVNRAAVIYALEPVFAWITSFVFLKETLTFRGATGAGLILIGISSVELKRDGEKRHQLD